MGKGKDSWQLERSRLRGGGRAAGGGSGGGGPAGWLAGSSLRPIIYGLLVVGALVQVYPIFFLLMNTFKTDTQILNRPVQPADQLFAGGVYRCVDG